MAYFCLAEDTPGDALAEETVMTIPRMGQGQWKNMSGTFPSFLYSGGERVQRSQRVAFFINWSAAAYRSQVTGKSEQMPTSERLKTSKD